MLIQKIILYHLINDVKTEIVDQIQDRDYNGK